MQCVHFEKIAPNHCERVEGIILANNFCARFFEKKSKMAELMKKESGEK